jgi:MFS family permease
VSETTKSKRFYLYLDLFTTAITAIGAVCAAAVVLTGLLTIGLVQIISAVWLELKEFGTPHSEVKAIGGVIGGVEFLLLAPVAYLVCVALSSYLREPPTSLDAVRAQADMLRVKAFIAGLLFALLSTEAVGAALSDKLNYEFAISISLIMSVMAVYFFMIERCASRAFAESSPNSNPSK